LKNRESGKIRAFQKWRVQIISANFNPPRKQEFYEKQTFIANFTDFLFNRIGASLNLRSQLDERRRGCQHRRQHLRNGDGGRMHFAGGDSIGGTTPAKKSTG